MIKSHTRSWQQVMIQWYNALREAGVRYWPRRRAKLEAGQGWLSSCVILGGPVQAVEETEAEVIIITTFPRLVSTEVTMELAGDRLLIQGKSPSAPPKSGKYVSHMQGSHNVLIRSAVLPCAVDLARANVTRKNDTVRITLPKQARGHLHRISGKSPG